MIRDIKERQTLMSNHSIIKESKNGENIKKYIKYLLKTIQFKLINFGENGSPLSSFISNTKFQIIENSDNNSIFQVHKSNKNNNNEDKIMND